MTESQRRQIDMRVCVWYAWTNTAQGADWRQSMAPTIHREGPYRFHWPELNADVELDALEQAERFPLVFHR
jgi:hypothetical protein